MHSSLQVATSPRSSLCRAPLVTMEFDPFGDVQACCANALFPLGNVADRTLDEIWRGPRAQLLRAALRAGDLSLGCSVCRHRLEHDGAELPLEAYAGFEVPDGDPGWPVRLSFSLHNTCNLACVMCGADRSSKIRSRRAGLAPLGHHYGDAFFEQLPPYLEHCGLVDFVGGEPFLIREHHRVWDLLEELQLRPRCAVTTNGTVWDERVERVLDSFDTDVVVSVDGMSDEVFESIRVGARRAEVLANLDRYRAYAQERGTYLAVNWTFVRHNWFELADAVRWAEDLGIPLNVMTVIEREHAVQRMADDELAEVATVMSNQEAALLDGVVRNRESWTRQRTMVESELRRRRSGDGARPLMEPWPVHEIASVMASAVPLVADQEEVEARSARSLALLLRYTVDHRFGSPQVVPITLGSTWDLDAGRLGVRGAEPPPDGGGLDDLLSWFEVVFGGTTWLLDLEVEGSEVFATLFYGTEQRDKRGVALHLWSLALPDRTELLVLRDDWFAADRPIEVAVRSPGV